jgi:hypothetical protein
MTVRKSKSMHAARLFMISGNRACEPSRRPGSFIAAIALAAFISPLGGCSGEGGGTGEGTVDISRAKEAAATNPDAAKAAAARNAAGLGDTLKGGKAKGRR